MHLVANSDIDVPDQYTIFAILIRKVMPLKEYPTVVYNKAGNVHINVTLGRVRITTFAVEKQYILHIFGVCL
jgi:PKD repeat protein